MSSEFEIKAPIDDRDIFDALLAELQYVGESEETDVYYDTPEATLFLNGVYLRIRNRQRLDLKYRWDVTDLSHQACHEDTFPLPLQEKHAVKVSTFLSRFINPVQEQDLFRRFGVERFVVITKFRETYRGKGLELVIDTIPDLGEFVEIKAKADAHSAVIQEVNSLRLAPLPVGYVELYLRKNRRELYERGRHKLTGDRI